MDSLISESRLTEKAFKKLSGGEQRKYLEKYPKSRYHKVAKVAKPKKAEKPKVKKKAKKSKKAEKTPEAVKAEVNKENAIEKRITEKVEENKPIVEDSLETGKENLVKNRENISTAVNDRVTPHLKKALGAVFNKIGARLSTTEKEREPIKKASFPILKVALGVGALAMLGPLAGPAIGVMAAKYIESFDFNSLSSESSDSLTSESSERFREMEENPIQFLVDDIARFMSKIDSSMLSEKLAEFGALNQMKQEDDGEEINEAMDMDIGEDDEDMVSESAVTKRLSFHVTPSQRRLAPNLRTLWNIRYGDDHIGQIQSDPKVEGNGHERRSWVVTLEDGFDESAFNSGYSATNPFTIVNKGKLLLRNPQRLTMQEARLWAKHTINKNYL